MRKPAIFVSSTCYDLKQIRNDTRLFLEGLGLEPVLSEFNTFPITPELSTLENCLKVVQDKCAILVLIVGSRYGSMKDQGKSVTNLEYITGRAKGVPTYVFVARSILEILPVWEKNPGGDYANVADSPKLFEFVSDLKKTGENWVFPFDTAQDIFDTLRTQLAYLFNDALELRLRAHRPSALPPRLLELQGAALRCVIERPYGWEYLLFGQVLQDELDALGDIKRDWQYGIAVGPGQALGTREFLIWVSGKMPEAIRISDNLKSAIERALPNALGPSGTSGDPLGILYVARTVATLYKNILEWKLDFNRIAVNDELKRLKSIASEACDSFAREIEQWCRRYNTEVPKALAASRTGDETKLDLTIRPTVANLAEFTAELKIVESKFSSGEIPP